MAKKRGIFINVRAISEELTGNPRKLGFNRDPVYNTVLNDGSDFLNELNDYIQKRIQQFKKDGILPKLQRPARKKNIANQGR